MQLSVPPRVWGNIPQAFGTTHGLEEAPSSLAIVTAAAVGRAWISDEEVLPDADGAFTWHQPVTMYLSGSGTLGHKPWQREQRGITHNMLRECI